MLQELQGANQVQQYAAKEASGGGMSILQEMDSSKWVGQEHHSNTDSKRWMTSAPRGQIDAQISMQKGVRPNSGAGSGIMQDLQMMNQHATLTAPPKVTKQGELLSLMEEMNTVVDPHAKNISDQVRMEMEQSSPRSGGILSELRRDVTHPVLAETVTTAPPGQQPSMWRVFQEDVLPHDGRLDQHSGWNHVQQAK